MSEAIIELKNIRKHYGKHEVLKGVDMQINRGDIYGLIGRNGAGKTTIFKMILGLSEITDGTVSVRDRATDQTETMTLEALIAKLEKEIKERK